MGWCDTGDPLINPSNLAVTGTGGGGGGGRRLPHEKAGGARLTPRGVTRNPTGRQTQLNERLASLNLARQGSRWQCLYVADWKWASQQERRCHEEHQRSDWAKSFLISWHWKKWTQRDENYSTNGVKADQPTQEHSYKPPSRSLSAWRGNVICRLNLDCWAHVLLMPVQPLSHSGTFISWRPPPPEIPDAKVAASRMLNSWLVNINRT